MKTGSPGFGLGVITVVLVGAALSSCGGSTGTPAFQQRDSVGIPIAESFGPAWGDGAGWSVGTEPLMRLGVVDGDESQQFHGVVGLAYLPDQSIVVADDGSQEIRFFNAEGTLDSVIGGRGEGPGEFMGLTSLGTGSEGLIWAYDFSLRRITWLDSSGGVAKVTSLGREPPMLNAVGHLPDGTFLFRQLWGATQVAQATQQGFRRDSLAFVRFGQGVLVDTLGLFPGREIVLSDEGGRGVMSTPPFARNSVGSLWGEEVVVGTQNTFELVKYGPEGGISGIVRIPDWDISLTEADLEAYIQQRLSQVPEERRPGARAELESLPIPDSKPAFGGFLADGAGNLWVSEWTQYPEVPQSWTVLDSSGAWQGSVSFSPRFFPYVIGENWVLGVESDLLDVEYVVMYPLRKN